jgi:DNA-binding LacI/PurR family transcriptional regulator
MKDVARLADVSVQTVSAVINGKPGISAGTSARVYRAIQELGYRPFAVARSLRTRQTRTIALVVHDISNPYFAAIAGVAEDHARAAGYSMVLYNTRDDVNREADYIRRAVESWVDGVLFVSTRDHMKSIQTLDKAGIPSVAVERIPEHYTGPSVTMDNVRAGQMAAEHLLALGHAALAHICGPLWLRSSRDRLAGFRHTIEVAGLALPGDAAPEGDWGCESGYQAMQRLLRRTPHPTAVFAANDRLAIGAMLAIHQAGLRVPGDVSIVGLDDIEVAAYQTPRLTTIRQSFTDLATQGVRLLLALLSGEEPSRPQVVLEPVWVERDSTGPPPQ